MLVEAMDSNVVSEFSPTMILNGMHKKGSDEEQQVNNTLNVEGVSVHHAGNEPESYEPFLDEIQISASWWEKHYVPGMRKLRPGWMKEVSVLFREARPAGVFCSPSAVWNVVSKSKRKHTWRAMTYCAGKPKCSCKYLFTLKRLSESGPHILNVQVTGKHSHTMEDVLQDQEKAIKRLRAGTKPAQLTTTASTKRVHKVLDTKAFRPFLECIQVSATWWEEHYVPGVRRLSSGWFKEVSDGFREARPADVYCSLNADWNLVSKSKRNHAWRAMTYCAGRPHCNCQYMFTLKRLSESGPHILNVQVTGEHCHSKEHVFRDALKQSEKEKCFEGFRAGLKPAQVRTLLKEQKASTERGRQELEQGNYHGVPSAATCRRLKHELSVQLRAGRKAVQVQTLPQVLKASPERDCQDLEERHSDEVPFPSKFKRLKRKVLPEGDFAEDTFMDVLIASQALDKKHCGSDPKKSSFFTLSQTPFEVAFSTPNMLETMNSLASDQQVPIAYVDCTGRILSKAPWSKDKIYLYTLVMKVKGHPPIPVSECISDYHPLATKMWLMRLMRLNGDTLPFKVWVCDIAGILTNAILEVSCSKKETAYSYNRTIPNIIAYLEACMQAKDTGDTSFALIVWCYARFLQNVAKKLGELLPKATSYRPIKKLYQQAMAYLARTDDLNTSRTFLSHLVALCESEYHTPVVDGALREISLIFGSDVTEVTAIDDWVLYEDDRHIFAVVDETVPSKRALPIDLPEEDTSDPCTEPNRFRPNTFRDSPFYGVFHGVIDEVRKVLAETTIPTGNYCTNPWRVKGFVDFIGEELLPFYPLWSMFSLRMLLPNCKNPLTNSAVELRFKLDKNERWVRPIARISSPLAYITAAVESAEDTILDFKYPDKPRRYMKRTPQ